MEERRSEYDSARLLTRSALGFVGVLILFVGSIIAVQIWKTGEANTESWAALTGLIGWVTGTVSMIYNARYGTTQQSAAKDATIAQQAHTAAVVAGAAPIAPAGAATIKAADVTVAAEGNVTVEQPQGKP